MLHDLTGIFSLAEPFGEMDEFTPSWNAKTRADLGPWRKYPPSSPNCAPFSSARIFPTATTGPSPTGVAAASIWTLRPGAGAGPGRGRGGVSTGAAGAAHALFPRPDCGAAGAGLSSHGPDAGLGAQLDALVIDEVQDLTLLQIACLTELVRARRGNDPPALRFAPGRRRVADRPAQRF
ncbi:MAG: hypothetical protein R2838_06285 [Caldilineaceae bacterium]